MNYEEPPSSIKKQEAAHRTGDESRQLNRDTRIICGLLLGARQIHAGLITVACLRSSEQPNLTGLVEVN